MSLSIAAQKSDSAKSKSGSATFHFGTAIFQNGTDTLFAHHFTAEPFLPRQVTELPLGKQTAAVDSSAAMEELGYAAHKPLKKGPFAGPVPEGSDP